MAKQEHKILEFHGGTNSKMDPRDIDDNQNEYSSLSISRPGKLTLDGCAHTLYDKTGINGKTISDISGASGGFEPGYGLFAFSHDYDMDSTPDEVDTEFIVTNDKNDIDIYDPNKSGAAGWRDASFTLGSRTSTVKPEFYNVDGALRACDVNFSVTDTSADTSADIGKNDVVLAIDNGASGNVTIATGSVIQIDQEIMYVTSGADGAQSITVIRGYANTKIATHTDNTNVFYANVPKYFGHIKADRLFECATSNSINTWVEDAQTPQPPNNTRKSDGTTGTLANSAGVQSLRVYDIIESSTVNYPTESEKVVLEFGESPAGTGIVKAVANDNMVTFTTSGYGNDASASHKLVVNDEIILSNMHNNLSVYNGNHVVTGVTSTTFSISFNDAVEELDGTDEKYYANASSFVDDTADFPNNVDVTLAESDMPFLDNGTDPPYGQYNETAYVHITGQTGVNAFNGIKLATRIDANQFRFESAAHASVGDVAGTTQVYQLIGRVSPVNSAEMINEDLKRKWNFAMSFTYDGPGQEVQESLLTAGHKITLLTQADGITSNLLDEDVDDGDETAINIDDASVLTDDVSVIMVGTEQMLITNISSNTITVTRGYNNSTKAAHSDNAPIFIVTELTPTETVDWTNFVGAPECVIKSVYGYGVDEKSWNARINGFKIYMKDVTEDDGSKEFRLFSEVNFNKGTYTLFGAGDSELILEQPASNAIATNTEGTSITIKPIDTYLSENLFTEQTIIDAQYKTSCVAGRKVYIGNVRQGGRTYPDRMLRTPVNKFDTFPETNFIDVAIGDGDSIIALESFGDRIVQFKKKSVYIINISGDSEVLESEYKGNGISFPSQVVKTSLGIAWITAQGLWFFDGQQAVNLTNFLHDDYTLGTTDIEAPKIAYEQKSNRLIYAPKILNGPTTPWYFYDLNLKAYSGFRVGNCFPDSFGNQSYYTSAVNDSDGNLIVGFTDGDDVTEFNIYKWDKSDKSQQPVGSGAQWYSKDMDFGSPAINKKIYKIYVTYSSCGHSGMKLGYSTNGSSTISYDIKDSSNYYASSGGFQSTTDSTAHPTWKVAELKPSSSINNIKSIQLIFNTAPLSTGDARGGSTSTTQLASGLGSTDYTNYNLYLFNGPGRYNSARISSYNTSTQTATHGTLADRGFGNAPTTDTDYVLGSIASTFEINDITVIFRAKRVK